MNLRRVFLNTTLEVGVKDIGTVNKRDKKKNKRSIKY
jgi:hypothetical protein